MEGQAGSTTCNARVHFLNKRMHGKVKAGIQSRAGPGRSESTAADDVLRIPAGIRTRAARGIAPHRTSGRQSGVAVFGPTLAGRHRMRSATVFGEGVTFLNRALEVRVRAGVYPARVVIGGFSDKPAVRVSRMLQQRRRTICRGFSHRRSSRCRRCWRCWRAVYSTAYRSRGAIATARRWLGLAPGGPYERLAEIDRLTARRRRGVRRGRRLRQRVAMHIQALRREGVWPHRRQPYLRVRTVRTRTYRTSRHE